MVNEPVVLHEWKSDVVILIRWLTTDFMIVDVGSALFQHLFMVRDHKHLQPLKPFTLRAVLLITCELHFWKTYFLWYSCLHIQSQVSFVESDSLNLKWTCNSHLFCKKRETSLNITSGLISNKWTSELSGSHQRCSLLRQLSVWWIWRVHSLNTSAIRTTPALQMAIMWMCTC